MTQNSETTNNEAEITVKIVSDPQKIKILVDPMRRRILRTMREGLENEDGTIRKEMTVPEIARKLGVSAPKCYHHLDLLLENGFVRIAKEEKKKRTSITYYERTSPAFILASTIDEIERNEGIRTDPLIAFINAGFKLGLSDKDQEEAQKLIDEYNRNSHQLVLDVSKQVKGNIPEDKIRDVINLVSNQFIAEDKRCQEIRKELLKFLKIEI